mmetsp:Transcript_73640/g.215803  ORF Transcript_73640/g.215803 Transcript_73640/m.215803 type:complete len:224 (-) Transcript_73640:94-765(-)
MGGALCCKETQPEVALSARAHEQGEHLRFADSCGDMVDVDPADSAPRKKLEAVEAHSVPMATTVPAVIRQSAPHDKPETALVEEPDPVVPATPSVRKLSVRSQFGELEVSAGFCKSCSCGLGARGSEEHAALLDPATATLLRPCGPGNDPGYCSCGFTSFSLPSPCFKAALKEAGAPSTEQQRHRACSVSCANLWGGNCSCRLQRPGETGLSFISGLRYKHIR